MTKLRWTFLHQDQRPAQRRESGQVLLILAMTFVGLAAFVGLTIDLGIYLVNQAHLRRAVDSAAIAAASQLRENNQDFAAVGRFATQFIRLNNVDTSNVIVQICADTTNRVVRQYIAVTDSLTTTNLGPTPGTYPILDPLCPTNSAPRKQVRVEVRAQVQFAFLPLIGFSSAPVSADATSEAASIDLVVVFGTGPTMGQYTRPLNPATGRYVNYATFDPDATCNLNAGSAVINDPENPDTPAKCRPLWDAKDAAKKLLETLNPQYDRVAIVGYDNYATVYTNPVDSLALSLNIGSRANYATSQNSTGAYAAIDNIKLRKTADLPPAPNNGFGMFSPWNVDCVAGSPGAAACDTPDPTKSLTATCVGCGVRVAANVLKNNGRSEALWIIIFLSDGYVDLSDVPDARIPGQANTITAAGLDAVLFPNGFCRGEVSGAAGQTGTGLWRVPLCLQGNYNFSVQNDPVTPSDVIVHAPNRAPFYDAVRGITVTFPEDQSPNPLVRFCGPYHEDGQTTCPPGAIFVGTDGYTMTSKPSMPSVLTYTGVYTPYIYNVYDYARDMADYAAFQVNCAAASCDGAASWPPNGDLYNRNEKLIGSPTVIYAIGLGGGTLVRAPDYIGERLLRYMAAVGDDGDRATDPCLDIPFATSCGNYYYAPNASALGPVFEDIARRIFTRLTQ